jgi:hypothetical protein
MSVNRLVPLSGVVFVVMVLVAIVALGGDTPDTESSAAEVVDFYTAHQGRQFAAAFVLAAAVPFLVFFAVSLARSLWPADPRRGSNWEVVLIAGSVIAGAAFLVAALFVFALSDAADQGVEGDALRVLNTLDADSWIVWNSGLGVMMLGAAGSLLASASARRWQGWTALVLGIALFIPFADFFALVLTGIWIIVVSVMLFRERSDAGTAVAASVP